jgi:hypothetical protein
MKIFTTSGLRPLALTICFVSVVLFSLDSQAQKFEITPQYGYQVGAKWNYYGGYVKLKSSDQYGLTANITLSDNLEGEFFWAQQNSSVAVKDVIFYPVEEEVTDATVDHFQLGVIHMFGYSEARPFVGMSAGWSTFSPDEPEYNTTTSFSFGFTGGLKYFFSDHVGIRLQGQLLVPVQWGGVYLGTGGGGVYTGGSILQLNFSGGLIVAI